MSKEEKNKLREKQEILDRYNTNYGMKFKDVYLNKHELNKRLSICNTKTMDFKKIHKNPNHRYPKILVEHISCHFMNNNVSHSFVSIYRFLPKKTFHLSFETHNIRYPNSNENITTQILGKLTMKIFNSFLTKDQANLEIDKLINENKL